MTRMNRPVLRYHGGKWKLAPWIISHFPPHKVYVEAYGGAASVLMRKQRSHGEVYNDMDGEIVNVFRVLRDEDMSKQLLRAIALTPFAREEFELSYVKDECEIEQARRTVARAFMGFGSDAACGAQVGFRNDTRRANRVPANDWCAWPEAARKFVERLKGVVIENRDAVEVMRQHDGVDTLHYADPPYPHSTRSKATTRKGKGYQHEMSEEQHCELAAAVRSLDGMVIISGYACDLYDRELYADWKRVERAHLADQALERTEVMWLNEGAASHTRGLFADSNTPNHGGDAAPVLSDESPNQKGLLL